jgi:hypothetical protein
VWLKQADEFSNMQLPQCCCIWLPFDFYVMHCCYGAVHERQIGICYCSITVLFQESCAVELNTTTRFGNEICVLCLTAFANGTVECGVVCEDVVMNTEWVVDRQIPPRDSDMHWVFPGNNDRFKDLLANLGSGGFGQLLRGVGSVCPATVKNLVIYNLAFAVVTYCDTLCLHVDNCHQLGFKAWMWNKNWEREWEDEFMSQHDWAYEPDTQQTKQQHCNREGYKLKGCIAKNIGRVKGEIMNSKGKEELHLASSSRNLGTKMKPTRETSTSGANL